MRITPSMLDGKHQVAEVLQGFVVRIRVLLWCCIALAAGGLGTAWSLFQLRQDLAAPPMEYRLVFDGQLVLEGNGVRAKGFSVPVQIITDDVAGDEAGGDDE